MSKHKHLPAVAEVAGAAGRHPIAFLRFPDRAVTALEKEAARIVAEDAERRANGGTSLHIVGSGGMLSGTSRMRMPRSNSRATPWPSRPTIDILAPGGGRCRALFGVQMISEIERLSFEPRLDICVGRLCYR
jgi:hypothetical protein